MGNEIKKENIASEYEDWRLFQKKKKKGRLKKNNAQQFLLKRNSISIKYINYTNEDGGGGLSFISK